MSSIILQGVITNEGKLQIEFLPDLPPGPVEVEIRLPEAQGITEKSALKAPRFRNGFEVRRERDDFTPRSGASPLRG